MVSDHATVRTYAGYDDVCVYNECNILSGLLFQPNFLSGNPLPTVIFSPTGALYHHHSMSMAQEQMAQDRNTKLLDRRYLARSSLIKPLPHRLWTRWTHVFNQWSAIVFYYCSRFYYQELVVIPKWITNHMPNKVWIKTAYRFQNGIQVDNIFFCFPSHWFLRISKV